MTTTTTTQHPPTPAAIMKAIDTPDGFERTVTTTDTLEAFRLYSSLPPMPVLILESPDTRIEIWFDKGTTADSWSLGSGHVSFDTSAGRRSFDRYGVEDSFYVDNPVRRGVKRNRTGAQAKSTAVLVAEQVNAAIEHMVEVRIPETRERLAKSESIPGIPFMVTSERRAEITATLKSGGKHSFMPSGFGTGYVLSGRSMRGARPAAVETRKFFGVSKLWVSTFDAD